LTTLPEHFRHGGPSVDYYDLREHGGPGSPVEGDVAFYRRQAKRARGPILELACGTGRVTCALADAGLDVTGLDASSAMLRVARRKQRAAPRPHLRFERGDMRRFSLPRRFALAIVPFRAFQHLLTVKDQRACLETIRRHLRPRGRLIIDLFDPRLEYCLPDAPSAPMTRPTVHEPATGEDVAITVLARTNDPVTQTFTETWRWTITRAGTVVRQVDDVLRLRWTYRYEMRHLFELTGYRVVAEYSDFAGARPRYGGEQIWIAERLR
jgi:ubiquinone/menaquinone biosynthesis C-methylase UbiE